MSIDPMTYREALGHYPTGVAIVTATLPSGAHTGMVVGTFSSVSLDPPLVAFMPMKSSRSFEAMRESDSFCINVLAADQLDQCRSFTTPKEDKFEGIPWHPAPSGAPILDDAVSWIDCSFHSVLEGGDHWIVLGEISDLAVQRTTLPLLFFQGGYGRFTPVSLVAPMAPDTIEAVRLAEAARPVIELLAEETGATVSIVAEVGDYAVFVAAANKSTTSDLHVGMRLPMAPPLGSVFYIDRSQAEVDEWIDRLHKPSDATRAKAQQLVDRVRQCNYSLSVLGPTSDEEVLRAAVQFASRDMTPQRERQVRQKLVDTIDHYEPEILAGETYDLRAIITPIPLPDDEVRLALRVSNLPPQIDGAEVLDLATLVLESARQAGQLMDALVPVA